MKSPQFEIKLTETGVSCFCAGQLDVHVNWDAVSGIAAYKRDLFSIDLVCLGLFRGSDEPIELAEDMIGWDELCIALQRRFGFAADWQSRVWLPPFGLSWLMLWGDAPPPDGRCWKCGYDLTGNVSGTCPECMTTFAI